MIPTLLASAAIGLACWGLAGFARWATRRAARPILRRTGLVISLVLGLSGLPFAALACWMAAALAMGQPGPEERALADGVLYRRKVLVRPRRVVLHILEVDLTRGHRLVASPPAAGLRSEAITATRALERLGADAVANASFFTPCREAHPLDFTPHEGELVQSLGTTIGRGERYGHPLADWPTFWSDPSGRVGFGEPPEGADAAVSGLGWLVREGEITVAGPHQPYARTAIGVDEARRRLWLVVVDGKQPRYSLGMTLREVADLFVGLGARDAIQLDGGGSSTLAARDEAGRPALLSRPCHTKVLGRQRPVANVLGIVFATKRRAGYSPPGLSRGNGISE